MLTDAVLQVLLKETGSVNGHLFIFQDGIQELVVCRGYGIEAVAYLLGQMP